MKRQSYLLILAAVVLSVQGICIAGNPPNVTMYGSFRYSLNMINEDGVGAGIDGIQGRDNISLFGIKGEWGNEQIKTFFHIQTQAFSDRDGDGRAFKQRFFYGGLKGGFGSVSVGRMTNAYKAPGFAMDPFYNLSHINAGGIYGAGGATYGLSGGTNGFTDNSFQYKSPDLKGITLVGGLYVDDSNDNDHAYIFGVSYNKNNCTIGIVTAMNGDIMAPIPGIGVDKNALRIYATSKFKNVKVGISFESMKTGDEDIKFFYTTSTVTLKDIKTDIAVSIGMVTSGAVEGFGITAGVFKTVIDNTKIYAMLSTATFENDASPFVASVGINANFSLFVNP
ncbi:porin [bacterium]|nr:porin [bacterium]